MTNGFRDIDLYKRDGSKDTIRVRGLRTFNFNGGSYAAFATSEGNYSISSYVSTKERNGRNDALIELPTKRVDRLKRDLPVASAVEIRDFPIGNTIEDRVQE